MEGQNVITLRKEKCEDFIEKIIERIEFLTERLNKSSAYTKEETIQRLKMLEERDYLVMLFYRDLHFQSHEYYNKNVKIQID